MITVHTRSAKWILLFMQVISIRLYSLCRNNTFRWCINFNPQAYFKYLESGFNGTVKIVYKSGNVDRFGLYRRYAYGDGLVVYDAYHFTREIQAALFSERYTELVIVKVYPNFMCAITKGLFLGEYIMNRDQHLKEVKDSCHVSRDLAKQLFWMIGFGSNYQTWLETMIRVFNHLTSSLTITPIASQSQ